MNVKHDQITIALSKKSHWLSIVEYKCDGYHTKELALVANSPQSFLGVRLVPLNEWFDTTDHDDETIINLLLNEKYEGTKLLWALNRAETYLSFFDGFEIVHEPSEDSETE
jgi:hypothetical protein